MQGYRTRKFPKTRIATVDVCEIGRLKHHIAAMIEIDVTGSREKIKKYKKEAGRISFTAWMIKVISHTVRENGNVAAFRKGKRKILIFDDINVSVLVEKEFNGQKVPVPLIIKKADEINTESITKQLNDARNTIMSEKDIVLQRKSSQTEHFYYLLPGIIRRFIWRYLLSHPHLIFNKMGNIAITSIGMTGKINGWFIPISVHPICIGIGSVIKKPIVIDDRIEIREMLNMTILMDHDVIDGAPMSRFIRDLSNNLEKGLFLQIPERHTNQKEETP